MITQIKNLLRRLLPKNAFAHGVSVLVGGTAGAQILLVLAAPLLTRLYSPEDFGLLAVYASLLALIAVVSSLRYELAIPLPKEDAEAANVAALCLILVAISTVLVALLVTLCGESIAGALDLPRLADYFWLLPAGVLLGGAYRIFNYWSVRTRRFTAIASTKLRQALATVTIQLAAFKLGGIALLFGHIAGQGVGTSSLGRPALTSAGFRRVSRRGIAKAARRYQRFPIFSTWAGLFNSGGTQLPPILIAAFFGATGAGFYALAHRVLTMPMSLLGEALKNVFFSGAAEAHREDRLGEKVDKLLDILIQMALPPAFLLALTAPVLFALVFGESWRDSGVMAQWMIPWLVLQFCTSPLTLVNVVTESQHLGLLMQVQLFIVRLAMILIGAHYDDLILTIVLFSLGSAFSYFIFLWVILRIVRLSIVDFLKSVVRSAIISTIVMIPMIVIQNSSLEIATISALALMTLLLIAGRYVVLFRYSI